jgi:hypothetical protein
MDILLSLLYLYAAVVHFILLKKMSEQFLSTEDVSLSIILLLLLLAEMALVALMLHHFAVKL